MKLSIISAVVRSVKDVMEEIELLLTDLKREQKDNYDALLRSEVSLWQECVFMERKITGWDCGDNDKELESLQRPLGNAANGCRVADEHRAVVELQVMLGVCVAADIVAMAIEIPR